MIEKTIDNFLSDLSSEWDDIEEATNLKPADAAKQGKAFAQAVQKDPKAQKAIGDMLAAAAPNPIGQAVNGQPAPVGPAPGAIGTPVQQVPAKPGIPQAPTGQHVAKQPVQQNPLGIGSALKPQIPGAVTKPNLPGTPQLPVVPGQQQNTAVIKGSPKLDATGKPIIGPNGKPLMNSKTDLRELSKKLNDEMHN